MHAGQFHRDFPDSAGVMVLRGKGGTQRGILGDSDESDRSGERIQAFGFLLLTTELVHAEGRNAGADLAPAIPDLELEIRTKAHRADAAGDSTIADMLSKGSACAGSDGADLRENRCESGILIWCGGHAGICV